MKLSRQGAIVASIGLSLAILNTGGFEVSPLAAADQPGFQVHIAMEQQGAHATGVLWLPAPPAAVAEILTDYEHWEELFPGRLRVVSIRREPERVVTDLHIRRFPLPGTLRLLCETHTAKDGSLVTSQLEGDFTEYRREWRLAPQARDGRPGTEGRLDLRFSLESWVPNWLLRRTLHQQLAEHFEVLYRRAQAGGAVQR